MAPLSWGFGFLLLSRVLSLRALLQGAGRQDQHDHWHRVQEEPHQPVLPLPALRLFDGWATFALLLQLQLGDGGAVDLIGAVGEA